MIGLSAFENGEKRERYARRVRGIFGVKYVDFPCKREPVYILGVVFKIIV